MDPKLPHLLAVGPWGRACPLRLLSGWVWLRSWIRTRRGRLEWISVAPAAPRGVVGLNALFAGLAGAKFGLCVASVGVAAASSRELRFVASYPVRAGRVRIF